MAWTYSTKLGSWIGLSSEVKPTNATEDDIGYEYDTKRVFIRKSNAWYEYKDNMAPITSIMKKFREEFTASSLDPIVWETVQIGAGATLDLTTTPGELAINTGTTAASETIIRSRDLYQMPFRLAFSSMLSQRIAGQEFYLEFVSVDPVTGNPDGKHSMGWFFDGTSATQAKYQVQNSALGVTSAASTILTSASYSLQEIEAFIDEVYFHSRAVNSTAARSYSYVQQSKMPDPNAFYKLQIRAKNVSGATTTAFKLDFVSIQDYEEMTVEVTAGRGNAAAGQGIYATVAGTVTVSSITAFPTPSANNLNSAATTNATSIKTSAGTVYNVSASNIAASARYLKFYNKASAPTVGTDIPILVIPIPAGSEVNAALGNLGHRFTTGIALAITGAAADADTTAIGASEVKAITSYV